MSTIRDVAERAGVSTMTVSRVVNNSGYVSQAARGRVEAAIAELGYVPNALARSLRFHQTMTLALILSDITNPFFTSLARGVEDIARAGGFNVIFCNTDESPEEQARYLEILVRKRVDGVLLVPVRSNVEPVAYLQKHDVPVVVVDRRVPDGCADMVRGDSEGGAYDLTCHLLDLGHRHIAMLTGPEGVSTADDRLAGYRRALARCAEDGYPMPERVFRGRFLQEDGHAMTLRALDGPVRPTAVFAANNFIAIGAYHALREANLCVPADISLVAFDDLPAALVMEPFLTVAAQPAHEMGERAAALLLARLAGTGPEGVQEIILPTQCIVRRSSGPPPAATPCTPPAQEFQM